MQPVNRCVLVCECPEQVRVWGGQIVQGRAGPVQMSTERVVVREIPVDLPEIVSILIVSVRRRLLVHTVRGTSRFRVRQSYFFRETLRLGVRRSCTGTCRCPCRCLPSASSSGRLSLSLSLLHTYTHTHGDHADRFWADRVRETSRVGVRKLCRCVYTYRTRDTLRLGVQIVQSMNRCVLVCASCETSRGRVRRSCTGTCRCPCRCLPSAPSSGRSPWISLKSYLY